MNQRDWKKLFMLALVLAGILSLCYYRTEQGGTLQTGTEPVQNPPVCQAETEEAEIALIFEVSHLESSPENILEVFARQGGKATFFLTGAWMREHQAAVRQISEQGHEIGFLGEECRDMSLLDAGELQRELENGRTLLEDFRKQEQGEQSLLFCPPYGTADDLLLQTAREAGFEVIGWKVDSLDWKGYGADAVVRQVLQNDGPEAGSVVRFHADAKETPEALVQILETLEQKGMRAVTVSELLASG